MGFDRHLSLEFSWGNHSIMAIQCRRGGREKGNAAVETVLVIVPLFVILLGIIDFSLAIFVMDTLEFAARQGVRYAITGQTGAGGQDASIRQVVKDNSLGFLGSADDLKITINYYALDTTSNTWQPTASNAGGNLVKVGVSGFSWAWMVPGWRGSSALNINTASADLVEGCPSSICPTR
jgi:Flp pilus assembly protein TadG